MLKSCAMPGTTMISQPGMQAAVSLPHSTGNNGSCSGSYLCTGKAGYDGPTGLGTPNGTGAF